MFRSRKVGSVVVVLALSGLAFVTTAGGVAVAGKDKIDKAAVLRVGVPIEANGGVWLDPLGPGTSAQNPSNRLWIDLIYDTMIHNTPDGKGEPGLAIKWEATDPNTVELTLRKGVEFTDGAPFNAAAVKASWDQIPNRVNQVPNIQAITEVEAVDDDTVILHLSSPIAQTLIDEDLKNSNYFAVRSPNTPVPTSLDAEPVGAGPYMLDSYETGHVLLKKNPTFYDKKQQKLKGVEFIDTPVGAQSVNALTGDDIDITWSIPPDSVDTINNTPGLAVTALAGGGVYTVNLCTTAPGLDSNEARQAVAWAIDRDAINEAALAGTGPPSVVPFGPESPHYDKKLAKSFSYKPKKAKSLLKGAGVEPGTTLSGVVPEQAPYPAIAEIVQSNLKDVGLDWQFTTSANFAADAQSAKPDVMTVQLDPTLYSLAFGGGSTVLNNCGYNNPELIAALDTARDSSQSAEDQAAAWTTFQEILVEEVPVVFLNQNAVLGAQNDKVKGFDIINAPYGPQISRISMVK